MKKETKEGIFIILITFLIFGSLMLWSWLESKEPNPEYINISEIAEEDDCDCNNEFEYSVVTVTRYNPVLSQCDSDPLMTADGSYIDTLKLNSGHLRWIAISRDLRDRYHYGDTIYLSSEDESINGEYVVRDTMNPRWTNRVDILSPNGTSLGKWEEVYVYKK